MTRRTEASALLTDIKCAAKDIMDFIEGMDYVAYADDNRTQAAVERKFEIISEAFESNLTRDCRTNS